LQLVFVDLLHEKLIAVNVNIHYIAELCVLQLVFVDLLHEKIIAVNMNIH